MAQISDLYAAWRADNNRPEYPPSLSYSESTSSTSSEIQTPSNSRPSSPVSQNATPRATQNHPMAQDGLSNFEIFSNFVSQMHQRTIPHPARQSSPGIGLKKSQSDLCLPGKNYIAKPVDPEQREIHNPVTMLGLGSAIEYIKHLSPTMYIGQERRREVRRNAVGFLQRRTGIRVADNARRAERVEIAEYTAARATRAEARAQWTANRARDAALEAMNAETRARIARVTANTAAANAANPERLPRTFVTENDLAYEASPREGARQRERQARRREMEDTSNWDAATAVEDDSELDD